MPTASEAAGRKTASRYGCGVSQPGSRLPNSYLERFQALKRGKRNAAGLIQGEPDEPEPTKCADDGNTEASTEKKDSRESQAAVKPTSEETPIKKSQLCAVL